MLKNIKKADPGDAQQIFDVLTATWPDQDTDLQQVQKVLNAPGHHTLVSFEGEKISGFVDGFLTVTFNGQKRWEVDLLAVHPDFRGRGLGEALVNSSVESGQLYGVDFVRAGIQIDNVASQRTFQRCGFSLEPEICKIMVSSCEIEDGGDPVEMNDLHIFPVDTLNYSGLWLEHNYSEKSLRSAQVYQARNGYDLVGAVIPDSLHDDQAAALGLGFTIIETYQWWVTR